MEALEQMNATLKEQQEPKPKKDFNGQVTEPMISKEMKEVHLMTALERDLNFINVHLLGKGSFGAVFSCSKDNMHLALKVILKQLPAPTPMQH